MQWNEILARRLPPGTHIVLHDGIAAGEPVLFFQLINARHERASTVLTSNKGFEEWGGVLGDEAMAAALIDRLVHHCHIVNIRGNSYPDEGSSEPTAVRLGSTP